MSPNEAEAWAATLGTASVAYLEVLEGLPLEEMIEANSRLDHFGPLLDPTRYRAAMADGSLDSVREVLHAARSFRDAMRAARARMRR